MYQIISIDETSIDTHIHHTFGWSKSGKKNTTQKNNKRIRYSTISAIGINKVIHTKIIKGSCNAETFLKFIKELLAKLSSNQKWSLLMDNARIHYYKKF
jgi:hypothetical protein